MTEKDIDIPSYSYYYHDYYLRKRFDLKFSKASRKCLKFHFLVNRIIIPIYLNNKLYCYYRQFVYKYIYGYY